VKKDYFTKIHDKWFELEDKKYRLQQYVKPLEVYFLPYIKP